MALQNKRVGAPIMISIGRRGERPDLIDSRIASAPTIVLQNGRPKEMVTVITAQQNLAGETYLGERVHDLAYAFDRSQRNELLDGPAGQPKSMQELIAEKSAATLKFFQDRPESAVAVELDSVE